LATAAVAEGASLGMVNAVGRAENIEWTHLAHGHRDRLPRNAFGPWDALEALPLRAFGLTQPHLRAGGELNEHAVEVED
jgi:hypothetical protein